MNARTTALSALIAMRRQNAWADGALKDYTARDRLDRRDAALAARLLYGVVQNRMLLDFYLAQAVASPLTKLQPVVLDILRLGAYQILFLDKIPVSAAVNEAVEQTKTYANKRAAGLVNGSLRTLARRKDELEKPHDLATKYSHPQPLVDCLRASMDEETLEAFLAADNDIPKTALQANPLKAPAEQVAAALDEAGIACEPHPWLPGCFLVSGTGNLESLPLFQSGAVYVQDAAAKLAVLASGAAAITYAVQALAQAGEHIVAQKTIYGGSYNLLAHTLPQFGISTTFVDAHDLSQVEGAIRPNTKAIYLETLGNPNSDIPDIDAIAAIAHRHGLPLVIDNTFGTPYLIRPIAHGADIVVHSATKFLGGHGTTLGGIIVDSGKFDWKASGKFGNIADPNPSYHGVSFADAAGPAAFVTYIRAILLRDTGATISPFNAFLLLQGTETLSLRIERHVENTKKVVEFLANHPQVEKVNHPSLSDHPDHALYEKYFPNGGASIFTFNIKGGREEAFKFIDNLKIFSLLANVADVKSLVIHPASTTHSQLNEQELAEQQIYQNTIRLSIGTEHIDDIIADLEAGFAAVRGE